MRRQLSDEVASHLRQAILAGELASGESVRAEAVGEALDVSATPVREALHALRVEGFLDLAPRKGFTVSPLSGDDVRDIFAAHALIAGELAARAAERASDGQLAELRALHDALASAVRAGSATKVGGAGEVSGVGGVGELERLNDEFHRTLYLVADSGRLRWALGTFVRYVPAAFYARTGDWPETVVDDHGEILAAVEGRDPRRAREAAAAHIRRSGELLADAVDRR